MILQVLMLGSCFLVLFLWEFCQVFSWFMPSKFSFCWTLLHGRSPPCPPFGHGEVSRPFCAMTFARPRLLAAEETSLAAMAREEQWQLRHPEPSHLWVWRYWRCVIPPGWQMCCNDRSWFSSWFQHPNLLEKIGNIKAFSGNWGYVTFHNLS